MKRPFAIAAALGLAAGALAPAARATTTQGVFAFDSDIAIWMVAASGGEPQEVQPNDDLDEAWELHPDLSPDAGKLALTRRVDGNWDIWTMGADGSNPVQLTRSAGREWTPDWSPDGRRIAFASNRTGKYALYVMASDGTKKRLVTDAFGWAGRPSWSPDGKRIAFGAKREGNYDLYSIRPDGSRVRRITRAANRDFSPSWSPDGRHVAFIGSDPVWAEKPFVVAARGGDRQRVELTDCDDECYVGSITWSPDGKSVAVSYVREETLAWYLVEVDLTTGEERPVVDSGHSIGTITWGPEE
ncbi:MAG TPA: hypothetical protein VG318_14510 [Actinomycetota bacterium]|nr:hypothetical protein [Actinomycetota bacterium]